MSYSWSFASFEPEALARLLGGGHERELDEFVDLVGMGSDEFGPPSDPEVARALFESGFSYEGFDARSARTADDIVFAAFSEAGFWDVLAMQAESPDGTPPSSTSCSDEATEARCCRCCARVAAAGRRQRPTASTSCSRRRK